MTLNTDLRALLAEVVAHYQRRGPVGHKAGQFIYRHGPALLAEVERLGKFEAMVKAAPTVAITECNQIAGASDFDFGDMTHAAQQFKPGQMVAIVPTSGATEES